MDQGLKKKLLKSTGRDDSLDSSKNLTFLWSVSTFSPLLLTLIQPQGLLDVPTACDFSFQGISDAGFTESVVSLTEDIFPGVWVSHIGWKTHCGNQKKYHDNLFTDEPGCELRPLQFHHLARTFYHCCSSLSSGKNTLEAKLHLEAGIVFSVCVHTKPAREHWFIFGLPVKYSHIDIIISLPGSALQPVLYKAT